MNWLDYVLVFIFLLNLYNGFRYGFLRQVLGLFSLIIALYAALLWTNAAKTYLLSFLKIDSIVTVLAKKGEAPVWLAGIILNIIAFLLVFFLVSAVLSLISRKLKFLNKIPLIGPLNAFIGGIFGALKGAVTIFLIIALLSLIETKFWNNIIDASVIVSLSRHYLPLLFGLVFDFVTGRLGKFV